MDLNWLCFQKLSLVVIPVVQILGLPLVTAQLRAEKSFGSTMLLPLMCLVRLVEMFVFVQLVN